MTATLSLSPARSTRHEAPVAPGWRVFDAVSLGVLALCALVLHRNGLTGGPAFYELDTRLFYFPLAQWVGQQLHAGGFPLWLPGIFTGYPIFADGELGLAYVPQVVLLALLPTPLAMVWLRVLHVFLAGLFTYAFLRTLRLDPLPSLGGALVFAFGSFLSAQMHHENVVRSAVWLPAVLACLELAACRPPRSAVVWSALGALVFAQSALGLHVQPVLMAALAIGGYALFRLAAAPLKVFASGVAIVGGGLAVAAVQWLPLGEWALVSSRRGGVDYEFATAFSLAPVGLLSAIFPYFFRLSDATTWWSLWQQWEIELYVGIPTLALALVGVVLARRTERVYFALLAVVSLWIGMADYAPVFNLHHVLWSIPGFSFLRAPGRFTYLTVFALACLAALGLQTLSRRRLRPRVALVGGLPAFGLLVALLVMLPNLRGWLAADPSRAAAWAQSTYLASRAQYPIDPALVVSGFLTSLDLANVKTAWSLVLLLATGLAFVVWLVIGPRGARLSQGLFVTLMAIDVLVFAFDFHPSSRLTDLAPDLIAPPGERVLMHDAPDLPSFEPDQLLAAGIPMAQGYSSLPSQRHVELDAATSIAPQLFDLWSAPVIMEPAAPSDLREVDGVRFRADHPLSSTFGGASPQAFRISPTNAAVTSVRMVGTLSYAFNAPQGQTVATLSVGGQTLPLRAGIELSERAYDRTSLAGLVQHQKAQVALDFDEATPEGEAYTAHLYEANVAVDTPTFVDSLTITATEPAVRVDIYGLGLVSGNGAIQSLDLANRDGLRRLNNQLLEDSHALPRAYVLPANQAFSPARHAGLTATQLVASPDVDLHSMVLIENDPNAPVEPSGSEPALAALSVEDLGPNRVRVTVDAAGPSYAVLDDFYHRGWTARIDGQPARVFIANALFRAVSVDTGHHVVEFRFEPLSHLIGAAVSGVSLLVVALAIAWGLRRSLR